MRRFFLIGVVAVALGAPFPVAAQDTPITAGAVERGKMLRFIRLAVAAALFCSTGATVGDLRAQQIKPTGFPPDILLDRGEAAVRHGVRDCGQWLQNLESPGSLTDELFNILILEEVGCDATALKVAQDLAARSIKADMAVLRPLLLIHISAMQYALAKTREARVTLDEAFQGLTSETDCFTIATRVYALRVKSSISFAMGDTKAARTALDQARASAQALAKRGSDCAVVSTIQEARVLETKARQALLAGDTEKARHALEEALGRYAGAQRPVSEMHILLALAKLTDEAGLEALSSEYIKRAEAIRARLIEMGAKGMKPIHAFHRLGEPDTLANTLWHFLDEASAFDPIRDSRHVYRRTGD